MVDAAKLTHSQDKLGRNLSTKRIAAIARNAFREAVRDRVLYNLVLFVLLLTACAIFIGELSGGEERRITIDLGLSAMLLFGVFISIFVGVGLVYKEIERRTVYAIFAKPVGRGEFLLGKYIGLCLTLLVNVVVMGAGLSLALIYLSHGLDPLVFRIWPAVLLIYFELMILTSFALLFSSFSSPALSALLTFFVFIIGHFSADLKGLATRWAAKERACSSRRFITCLPNLCELQFHHSGGQRSDSFNAATCVPAILYALLYISIILSARDTDLQAQKLQVMETIFDLQLL